MAGAAAGSAGCRPLSTARVRRSARLTERGAKLSGGFFHVKNIGILSDPRVLLQTLCIIV
ncbi:hypothetical protein D9599_24960 [Roseomonas sp. KE2513]|nr:hypothetical protein [Roseomonas sp. KE2513]